MTRILPLVLLILLLGGCTMTRLPPIEESTPAPTAGRYKVGDPYQVKGVWYRPAVDPDYDQTGIASWYGPAFHLRPTANGERFDMNRPSAAHKTLPLPSIVEVTNLENGRSMNLRVNDRGPFVHGRIIDLSRRAARLLGLERQGTARVRVRLLPEASIRAASVMPGWKGGAAKPNRRNPSPPACAAPGKACPSLRYGKAEESAIFIQLGAFGSLANARGLQEKLRSHYPNVAISPVWRGRSRLHRVRLGPLPHLARADDLLEELIGSGYTEARLTLERKPQ